MEVQDILKPASRDQLKTLTRQELVDLLLGEQEIRKQAEAFIKLLEEEVYLIGEKYVRIKNKIFCPSSEKFIDPQPEPKASNPDVDKNEETGSGSNEKNKTKTSKKPSERYPNTPIIEQNIEIYPLPPCTCCGSQMVDSGMTESSESLSVTPKQYFIKRKIYHKYCCKTCHGSIETAPTLPKIKPGSSYDDELVVDVSMSKFCDLIPIERYTEMAKRQGFVNLPPHSLIELTHYLAAFLKPVYELIRQELLSAYVLHADETPHRMLEGDKKKNWFLWGFSTETASYFECHNTRSGDVASSILSVAECRYLVSDVYSGYNKAVTESNKIRLEDGRPQVKSSYCNAHARRKFNEISGSEGVIFLKKYGDIYEMERDIKEMPLEDRVEKRKEMQPIFEFMRNEAQKIKETVSNKSSAAQAADYFLKNYVNLTHFIHDPQLPIDNNHQERLLRSPVVGRKTWYGTHSKKGATTTAILFSIVESCKLNHLNPRDFVNQIVKAMHRGEKPYTPRQAVLAAYHSPPPLLPPPVQ